jgi:site-specific DNA-methyltransferase (adenine-specific)
MVTIYCGDCLDVMREMPSESIDTIITDPPYFLPAEHYKTRRVFARSLCDLSILEHFFREVFDELSRVTKESAVYYCFCDGQSYPVMFVCAYPKVRRIALLVWDKVVSINGYSWRHQHELILFAQKPGSVAVPTGDGDILRCRAVPVDRRLHPAEKPVELLSKLISKSVPMGGVILDPFMGSGSVGIAAAEIGRGFVGIEIDERYCELAVKRLLAKAPLLAAAGVERGGELASGD